MANSSLKTPDGARKFVERRSKNDWVVKSVNIIAIIGWALAAIAIAMADKAQPLTENMITRILNVQVVSHWDISLLRLSFAAILFSFLICLIGFFVNMTRHRRKTDRYSKPIITLGIISLAFIMIFLFRFNHLIF